MTHAELGLLGEIVSWKSPASVDFSRLKSAMVSAGLDPDMAKDMLPRHAFSRAAKKLEENRIIRKIDEDDSTVTFQFTKERLNGTRFEYNFEARLYLDKEHGIVVCSENADLANEAERLLKEEQEIRRSADVTRLVQKVFETHKGDLVPLREQGGVYFVPETHRNLIESVECLMVGIAGKLRRFAVSPDHGSTSTSVADSMAEHFQNLLEEFNDSCSDLTKDTSEAVADRRREKMRELKVKLDSYKYLLQSHAEAIESGVEEAEKALFNKLAGIEGDPEDEPDAGNIASEETTDVEAEAEEEMSSDELLRLLG